MRPRLVVVVAGTGTEVGKTWLSAEVIRRLQASDLRVCARKPAQSFERTDRLTDADVLGAASGEPPSSVCPQHRWYPVAMAPPMAAAALERPAPLMSQMVKEIETGWPRPGIGGLDVDVGLVEGAGGVASPLAVDGDTSDLAKRIGADLVVLVADPGLGTINAVRLGCRALEPLPTIVYLNRYDPGQELHSRNWAWLSEVDGLSVCRESEDLSRRIVERLDT